jgi:hypothetical protein
MVVAGETKAEDEIATGFLALLEALAGHVESVAQRFRTAPASLSFKPNFSQSADPGSLQKTFAGRSHLLAGAVEALLVLAYSRLVVDDRSSFNYAFVDLERSLPLIGASVSSTSITAIDVDDHYGLRSVASAYYNIGGTLFNASKPEAAIRFVRRACQITEAALKKDESGVVQSLAALSISDQKSADGGPAVEERQQALTDLQKHLSKRWELLALAQHSIGEKKVRAFVSRVTRERDVDSVLSTARL